MYDSLGIPLDVRLTTVLESRDSDATTYRWFADCGDNDPAGPDHRIAVGTGLISFDGEGNLIQADNAVVNIDRQDFPSVNPLVFNLDFSQVSGFASETSSIAASRQDGSAVGTLTSYSVGEGGEIMGVFSNGISRTLGPGPPGAVRQRDRAGAARRKPVWARVQLRDCPWRAIRATWDSAISWPGHSNCRIRTPART